jgi:Ni2+-binding GTPase involved in maturation of urease and hydrogenase
MPVVMPFDNVTAEFGLNVPKTELKKDELVQVFRQEGDIIKLTPLFIRKHLVEQRDILSTFLSSKKYNQLYVSGPPGCGKTSFIWLWARMHAANEKKRALVIQYRPRNACHVFRFEADGRIFRKRSISYEHTIVADLETLLTEEGGYDLCVFDGVRQNLSQCSYMLSVVNGAPNITKKINVTSLAFTVNGGDQSLGWDTTLQFTAFDSWTECDYKEAVKYDDLASMLMILETPSEGEFSRRGSTLLPDSSVVCRREVVLDEVSTAMSRKYFYAGGSARYMFEYTLIGLKETLESLLTSIESDDTWESFVNEVVSPNTPTAVNTLMQQFKMACAPLSKYVLFRAYEKMSQRLTDAVKSVGEKTKNPSIRGWAFELEQLGIIKNAVQANTKMAVHSGAGLIIRPISEVEYAGGQSALDKAVVQGVTVIWCLKWNQGCFDAAIYDNGTLITLQFTVSISHSVKLEHLTELRETLLKSELPVNDIFHAAIVPKDNLSEFAFGTPEGLGYQNKSELPLYTVRVCKSCAFALQTDDNGMEAKNFHCMLVGEDFEVHGPRKGKRSRPAVTLSS